MGVIWREQNGFDTFTHWDSNNCTFKLMVWFEKISLVYHFKYYFSTLKNTCLPNSSNIEIKIGITLVNSVVHLNTSSFSSSIPFRNKHKINLTISLGFICYYSLSGYWTFLPCLLSTHLFPDAPFHKIHAFEKSYKLVKVFFYFFASELILTVLQIQILYYLCLLMIYDHVYILMIW